MIPDDHSIPFIGLVMSGGDIPRRTGRQFNWSDGDGGVPFPSKANRQVRWVVIGPNWVVGKLLIKLIEQIPSQVGGLITPTPTLPHLIQTDRWWVEIPIVGWCLPPTINSPFVPHPHPVKLFGWWWWVGWDNSQHPYHS